MNTVEAAICLGLGLFAFAACDPAPDETRLKRREILYHFEPLSGDCTALFGAGAVRDTTPDGALTLLGKNLNDFSYLGIEGEVMHIDLPWPYDDIDVPITMEHTDHGYIIKGAYGKIALTFTSYALDDAAAVIRVDGKFCHRMPQFLKEHILATCIKNIVKTIRKRRD